MISKLPEFLRRDYVLDCLQAARFATFKSSLYLIQSVGYANLEEIQKRYSKFLVFTASEWFRAIPTIQNMGSPLIERYLRLVLSELLERNIIQETEGWNKYLIHTSLILWPLSPVVPRAPGSDKLGLAALEDPPCVYCEQDWPCMAKEKGGCHRKKFCCLVQAGVHLCKVHGEMVFREDRPLGTSVELDDGRRVWGVGRADFIDRYGIQLFDPRRDKVLLNTMGEYEMRGSPRPGGDWFLEEPDELEETELRVRGEIVKDLPPQAFWDSLESKNL